MITVRQALAIHAIAIKKFGGSSGLRDISGLKSALTRPFQTYGGEELYSTIEEKRLPLGKVLL